MPYLTDEFARELVAPSTGQKLHWDADADGRPGSSTSGFGLRITSGGARSWVLRYRVNETGTQRLYKIGRFPALKAERARKLAEKYAANVAEGHDPQGKKSEARKATRVSELLQRFDAEHIAERCRASTAVGYRVIIRRHIEPTIGHKRILDVTTADIIAIHQTLTRDGKPYQANRTVVLCHGIFELAIQLGYLPKDATNPASGVRHNREQPRHHHLEGPELACLLAALAHHPDTRSANAIKLLILTGARRGEVLGMRWLDLDLAKGLWNRRAADLKSGRNHAVPLNKPALDLLRSIHDEQSRQLQNLGPFVFPSAASKPRHLVEIRKFWRQVTKDAGIDNLRLHDLRHSFASTLVSSGKSIELIGSLLDHRKAATTKRYAEAHLDPKREAVEIVGEVFTAASPPSVDRLPMVRRGG
jgi:integrase